MASAPWSARSPLSNRREGHRTKISDERIEYCIACGQCVAICPHGAISHSEFPATTIRSIQFEQMPTTEQVMALLKTRRSIRAFRDKPLARETIETIIDGARFAPSGHNSQSTEFLVVQDRAVLNQVSAMVIEYLKFEIRRFANPLFRTLALLADREKAESGLHEIPGFKRMIRVVRIRRRSDTPRRTRVTGFSCSADHWVRGCQCTIGAAECLPCRPLLGYRALLHRLGARSLSRAHGAGMEPAHSRLDWHSTWKRAAWRFGAWDIQSPGSRT